MASIAEQQKTSSSLRFLLQSVGFKDDGLEVAIAIAMAVSGGDASLIDTSGRDTKWGARIGLYQVRSLLNPSAYEGLDSKRVRSKLLNAPYNAQWVYERTNGGTDWSMFDEHTNGSYKKFYKKNQEYQLKGWTAVQSDQVEKKPAEGTGEAAEGAQSASAFMTFALRQCGEGISAIGNSDFPLSELVSWAAGQAGVRLPEDANAQIMACKSIPVEDAVETRGALLWYSGHIAISLGNGRVIENTSLGYGVCELDSISRYQRGGLIPGMRY